jgi:hypothetical protein
VKKEKDASFSPSRNLWVAIRAIGVGTLAGVLGYGAAV